MARGFLERVQSQPAVSASWWRLVVRALTACTQHPGDKQVWEGVMEREKVGKALSWLVPHLVGVVEGALLVAWTGSNRFLLGLAGRHGSQRGGHASTPWD